jgi:flotillin
VLAKADAERMKIQAEAAASHNRVALDRMLIDQLPQIVREAAGGLANANINVLNGADGLGQLAAGLVGQGLSIFESIRSNLGEYDEDGYDDEDQGSAPPQLTRNGPPPAPEPPRSPVDPESGPTRPGR